MKGRRERGRKNQKRGDGLLCLYVCSGVRVICVHDTEDMLPACCAVHKRENPIHPMTIVFSFPFFSFVILSPLSFHFAPRPFARICMLDASSLLFLSSRENQPLAGWTSCYDTLSNPRPRPPPFFSVVLVLFSLFAFLSFLNSLFTLLGFKLIL
jgi:hypothetical protein